MLDYIFVKLGVDGETVDHPILMTETLCNPLWNRSSPSLVQTSSALQVADQVLIRLLSYVGGGLRDLPRPFTLLRRRFALLLLRIPLPPPVLGPRRAGRLRRPLEHYHRPSPRRPGQGRNRSSSQLGRRPGGRLHVEAHAAQVPLVPQSNDDVPSLRARQGTLPVCGRLSGRAAEVAGSQGHR